MPRLLDEHPSHRIDESAADLFRRTCKLHRAAPQIPFPIDAAIADLGLTLAWVDMQTILPTVKSLAFLSVPMKTILVNEELHPNAAPNMCGRLRFTLAHELGHWCCHQGEKDVASGWWRRDVDREAAREKEANRFAGALLIPTDHLREHWHREFGAGPITHKDLAPQREQLIRQEIERRKFQPLGEDAEDKLMFEGAISQLAAKFEVSPQALRIRAEQLGLIIR